MAGAFLCGVRRPMKWRRFSGIGNEVFLHGPVAAHCMIALNPNVPSCRLIWSLICQARLEDAASVQIPQSRHGNDFVIPFVAVQRYLVFEGCVESCRLRLGAPPSPTPLPSSLTTCTLRQRPTPRACIAWGSFLIAVEEREPSVPRKITEGSPKGGCSQNRTVLRFPDLVQEFPIPHAWILVRQ